MKSIKMLMKWGFSLLLVLGSMSVSSAQIDQGADGMSDVWQSRHHAEGIDPDGDDDGDDMSNLEESIAGTDPFTAASSLSVTLSEPYVDIGVIEWVGAPGVSYQLQKSETLVGDWQDLGVARRGHGGPVFALDPTPAAGCGFYRVKVLGSELFNGLPAEAELTIGTRDTDGDELSDLSEMRMGTDPFDANSHAPQLTYSRGNAVNLSWQSVVGKRYRVQYAEHAEGPWQDAQTGHQGTGELITTTVTIPAYPLLELKVLVEDIDSDGDGLTDWEELQLGLDPELQKSDPWGEGDLVRAGELLNSASTVSVQADVAVANITRMSNGAFEIVRTGGVKALEVQYTVSGTALPGNDYTPLSGSVTIPFGVNSVVIPVVPSATSSLGLSESVIVTLQDTASYDLGLKNSQQINVIREVAINVKDYGALGDGLANDTAAIEAAIGALEASDENNTLFFPAGTYRLSTSKGDSSTPTGSYRILKLGRTQDLAGRDLIFKGEAGSVLYSDVGSTRAHVILALASYRSLRFENLRIEQSPTLLWVSNGTEPNGSDGVAITYVDTRKVESIDFNNCIFYNCHRSVSIYGNGYDIRGKCGRTNFINCHLLNPYGSNTHNGSAAWGGGQQVYLSPWIGKAVYEGCHFDGGSEDMTDTNLTGGGRMKDGCHFGSPLRLIFRNNVVKRMSVEAVFHTNDITWMGATKSDFAIPAADGTSTVQVQVSNNPSTWVVGDQIVIRQPLIQGVPASNNHLIIHSVDNVTKILHLINEGHPDNAPEGTVIRSGKTIYRDHEPEPPCAIIEGNFLEGTVPPGGKAFPERAGIVFNSRALVQNNVIANYSIGVLSYEETHTPQYPAATGSTVKRNMIVTKDAYQDSSVAAKGIYLAAQEQTVRGNLILCPTSYKTYGILHSGRGLRVVNNNIGCETIMVNGYNSWNRAVGIAQTNTGSGMLVYRNTTRGFDVGVGPGQANQWRSYYLREHKSYQDVLGNDPIGLTQEP